MRFFSRLFRREPNYGLVIELTVKEVADILGIQPASVRQQIGRGRLHASKRGSRDWFITPAEVKRYQKEVQHD